MRILLLPFIVLLIPTYGYSQWIDPSNGAVVEPTATMSQFMRYGNTPVSLYTGSAEVSVPIYTYEDYEFNIPIALQYAFKGQKPNDPAGSFGLGWVLTAGGCVTREVRNYPDDSQNMEPGHRDEAYGFYYLHTSGMEIPSINSSGYPTGNNLENELYSYFYPVGGRKYEAEPDIFSFSFPGHSGKFVFWEKRKIIVYQTNEPEGNYVVEPILSNTSKFIGFTIRTRDGFSYTFGNNSDLELNDDMWSSDYNYNSLMKAQNAPHVMWPLVSIQSPSGRIVNFEYTKSAELISTQRPTSFIVESNNFTGTTGREIEWLHVAYRSQQKQRNLYLKTISMSNTFSIDFTYSGDRKAEQGYDMFGGLFPITTEGLLQSVVVKDLSNGSVVKTARCSYTEGHPNRVPILDNVFISGLGYYGFNYWNKNDSSLTNSWTPYKGTCNVDHWGYSNGVNTDGKGSGVGAFIPTSTLSDNKETITSYQREPNFNYAVCGALRYISYPTEGKTEFIYEPNDYSVAIIKYNYDGGNPRPEYYNNNQTAGGIRVKQIIDYSPTISGRVDTMRVRTYDYHVNGKSTGVLLQSPRYKTSHIKTGSTPSGATKRFVLSADILDCIDTDHHIEYSLVTEKNRDGSYCNYSYSTYAVPQGISGFDRADDTNNMSQTTSGIFGDPYLKLYMRPASYKMMRGKLCSKVLYHAKQHPEDADVPSYGEYYKYTTPGSSIWAIRMTRYYWYSHKIYTSNCYINEIGKTNYYPDNKQMSVTTYYQHDSQTGYVSQVRVSDPLGKETRQDIYYSATNKGPYPIKTHFQVLLPGETQFKTTEINKYEYMDYRVTPTFTIPRLIKHWKTNLDKPKIYASDTDQENDLIVESQLGANASRVYEYKDRAGNVTAYLYGEGGCNLLAIIKNVSYSEAMTAIGNPYSLGRNSLTSAQEAALRSLPQALVTTYSYTPFCGLASVTDPSGCTQNYTYDAHCRLAKIYSGGHLENEFKYQINNLR